MSLSLLTIANLLATDTAKQRARAALLVATEQMVAVPLPAKPTKADEETFNRRRLLARQIYNAPDHWVGQMAHSFALTVVGEAAAGNVPDPDDKLTPQQIEAVDQLCVAGFVAIYDQFIHMVVPA